MEIEYEVVDNAGEIKPTTIHLQFEAAYSPITMWVAAISRWARLYVCGHFWREGGCMCRVWWVHARRFR